MRIISMAWTSAAFRAERKTVTRRRWATEYALRLRETDHLQAWDKDSRVPGAQRIGVIRITHRPYLENMVDAPDSDYEAEGLKFYEEHPHLVGKGAPWAGPISWATWETWKAEGGRPWVVRFEILEIDHHLEPEFRQGGFEL